MIENSSFGRYGLGQNDGGDRRVWVRMMENSSFRRWGRAK